MQIIFIGPYNILSITFMILIFKKKFSVPYTFVCTHWNVSRFSVCLPKNKNKNVRKTQGQGKMQRLIPLSPSSQVCIFNSSPLSAHAASSTSSNPTLGWRQLIKGKGKPWYPDECTLEFMGLAYVLKCHRRPEWPSPGLYALLSSVLPCGDRHNHPNWNTEWRGARKRKGSPGRGSWLTHFTLSRQPPDRRHCHTQAGVQSTTVFTSGGTQRLLQGQYLFLKHTETHGLNSEALKRHWTLNWKM